MNYTWNSENKTVSYTLPWDETLTVAWEQFFAYWFVVSHLYWDGRFKSVLNAADATRYFLKCDGFGKFRDWMHYFSQVGGYDWSHVRDSNYETMLEIAQELAAEFWDKDFATMASERIGWAESVGKTPPEFLYS